ncbi:Acyltransferase LovD [Madurella mycetomatis]|uniref:Acyltransferase LovD n=1 Tax=Madurella mycetomatis TaxID=100816 RepID=A0A175VV14_9PEZI|nr:Acyltransferase LovD [Madurella mycetomatis]
MAETLDSILKRHVAHDAATKDKLLGAAFIVLSKNGVLYEGNAGRTRQPADSPPFGADSVTYMASMTKMITAACAMQLVDRGQIELDDDVRPLVPELAGMQILTGFADSADGSESRPVLRDNPHPITLRHLLTHTSGLAYAAIDPDLQRWARHARRTANSLLCTLDSWTAPLKFPPGGGGRWCYGTSVDWAGQVVERVAGCTLGAYARANVLGPLGMARTGFRLGAVLDGGPSDRHYVPGSVRIAESGELAEGRPPIVDDPPVESGGAGLYGCAADYARFVRALLRALAGEGEGLLSKGAVDEMFTPQLNEGQREELGKMVAAVGMAPEFPVGTPMDHGLSGVMNTEDVPGKRRKGSMMWAGQCNARWWIDPKTGIGAVLFLNVLPYGDAVVAKLYHELELAVYAELVPKAAEGSI